MRTILPLLLLVQLIFHVQAQSPHASRLYGMTQYGGPDHKGSIFHYIPSTQQLVVDYEFKIKVKGAVPMCDMVSDNAGTYYGSTTSGGLNNYGVIFSWDSLTGTYTELYDFNGTDGSDPRGGMILYNGKFYGMTRSGGTANCGTLFEWDPVTDSYTKKVDLDSINGKKPEGTMTLVGTLFYGCTNSGGLYNKGVLFKWDPVTNVYTKQYDFDGPNGANPVGKLMLNAGKLYAMTTKGGANDLGVIYEWNYTPNVVTKKIDFNGTNGSLPLGSLALYNNKFYGLTHAGGIYQTNLSVNPFDYYGVIFEWNPANNAFVKKRDLGNPSGPLNSRAPLGTLTLKGNIFWGSNSQTSGGGNGAIFSWDPVSNSFADHFMTNPRPFINTGQCEEYGNAPGGNAYGAMLLSGDKLLCTSSAGAGGNAGCIFEYFPDSNQVTRAVHMLATDGSYPKGSLSQYGNKLVGLTYQGGNNHYGTIFEWDMDAQQFTEKIQLNGYTTGINPVSSLTFFNGKYYGINLRGKSFHYGGLSSWGTRKASEFFSWDPLTNDFQTLPAENALALPASLLLLNSKLYTTSYPNMAWDPVSGSYAGGAILEFDPATNAVDTRAYIPSGQGSFSTLSGNRAANGVSYYNGKFYGMTPAVGPSGTINFKGTIYECDTAASSTTVKINFVDSIGSYPTGDLLLVDSVFYGLTTGASSAGAYSYGSLFRWSPATNNIEKKVAVGSTGTPALCEGKIYYLFNEAGPFLCEYDPVLDTVNFIQLPSYGGPLYSWFSYTCKQNSIQQLLTVIPNQVPVLSNTPGGQTICNNQPATVNFTITDMDNDTMSFQLSSNNNALIPSQTISVSNTGNTYTLHYSAVTNQTGSATIHVIANDGYGGLVQFSFPVTVAASPDTGLTQNGLTLTALQSGALYQWMDCSTQIPVAGENNQSFTGISGESYALVITQGSCTDTSACYLLATTGLQNINTSAALIIYPNPVKDQLMIQTGKTLSMEMYTVDGRLVERLQIIGTTTVNVSTYENGVYLLKATDTDGTIYRSVLIK